MSSSFFDKLNDLIKSYEDIEEEEFDLGDLPIRKSIGKKMVTNERLNTDEYLKLLEFTLEEFKRQHQLEDNGKLYQMTFKEIRTNEKEY